MDKKLALMTFSLLAFSLILAGCLNQGGSAGPVAPGGGQIQPLAAQEIVSTSDTSELGQDVSSLEVNESDFIVQ